MNRGTGGTACVTTSYPVGVDPVEQPVALEPELGEGLGLDVVRLLDRPPLAVGDRRGHDGHGLLDLAIEVREQHRRQVVERHHELGTSVVVRATRRTALPPTCSAAAAGSMRRWSASSESSSGPCRGVLRAHRAATGRRPRSCGARAGSPSATRRARRAPAAAGRQGTAAWPPLLASRAAGPAGGPRARSPIIRVSAGSDAFDMTMPPFADPGEVWNQGLFTTPSFQSMAAVLLPSPDNLRREPGCQFR